MRHAGVIASNTVSGAHVSGRGVTSLRNVKPNYARLNPPNTARHFQVAVSHAITAKNRYFLL
jgi:hypothetical protein